MKRNPERSMRVLGIMSGTSLDGVDYALCRIRANGVELLDRWHAAFPSALRRRLQAAARDDSGVYELGRLHHELGRFYAREARRGLGRRRIDAAALHGQTVFHEPAPPGRATLQIGEPAWLVETLGAPVVSNFRAADLAAGGQGAPLATEFHRIVFARQNRCVCVNNLGGISNVTALDWRRGRQPALTAFDTGPANLLLDLAARHFSNGRRACDRNGRLAAKGEVHGGLLDRWLGHPFICRPPPKSTGREEFGEVFWERARRESEAAGLNAADVLATLTAFTAASLAMNYRLHLPAPPDELILCGGGARNPTLRHAIARAVGELNPAVEIRTSAELGWPSQAIEPAAFAWLAALRLEGRRPEIARTTGARRAALLGQVSRP